MVFGERETVLIFAEFINIFNFAREKRRVKAFNFRRQFKNVQIAKRIVLDEKAFARLRDFNLPAVLQLIFSQVKQNQFWRKNNPQKRRYSAIAQVQ
jgi:hypothetical protein